METVAMETRVRRWAALLVVASLLGCAQPPVEGGKGTAKSKGNTQVDAGDALGFVLPEIDAAPRPPCTPITCATGPYCGEIGDGCGNKLTCGGCAAGLTCGGGGAAHVCGKPVDPGCKPIDCKQAGGQFCGRVGDGCGRALECGACPTGQTCGAGGPNVCGGGGDAKTPPGAACDNLCQRRVSCPTGGDTTISGTVFAPTPPKYGAADPLYGALVYVPNAAVEPFAPGVACDQCGRVSGSPLVTALTGPDGTFTLKNVPAGADVPLVIQIGRWRRQVKIPNVAACADTALPAELTHLPRTRAEGDIPLMAIATGTYDPFECTLRKIGVADAEFTNPGGDGRVNMFHFGGSKLDARTPAGAMLVGSPATLGKYDIVLLPCDDDQDKPPAQLGNLVDYAGKGGRIFLTDWGYSWLRDRGTFQGTVAWKPDFDLQGEDFMTLLDQTFPKGVAFAAWLKTVGASPMPGMLAIHDPYSGASNVDAIVPPTQRWLYTEAAGGLDGTTSSIQHFTFNTPVGAAADKQCGRVVFSQFHVAHAAETQLDAAGCDTAPMTPQEKALEFMLFDATSCILPDNVAPAPPHAIQPPPPAPPPPPPVVE
jgi:hypothetical protein